MTINDDLQAIITNEATFCGAVSCSAVGHPDRKLAEKIAGYMQEFQAAISHPRAQAAAGGLATIAATGISTDLATMLAAGTGFNSIINALKSGPVKGWKL